MATDARATAWLDRLEGLHTAATPGPWSAEPTRYGMDVIAAERPDRFIAAEAPLADAAAIVAEHNHFAALLALARGVAELHRGAFGTGNPGFDNRCVADGHDWPCPTIRLLADAAPDTGEETA